MPNHLASEKSPYLLQHADNPVDWYPWGREALEVARREDKPILVSIGYSACHWCHVMAHESFEDPGIADFMNQHFINIKVDREERPDVDAIYMEAVQALSGHGGWPLNVFLVPDGRPFFGGTYFPPEPKHGLPSWQQVLQSIDAAYREQRDDLVHNAEVLTDAIQKGQQLGLGEGRADPAMLRRALEATLAQADWVHGGFGAAPKFPQPLALEFLLRMHHITGDKRALELLVLSLNRMADGGIFDHLGGGFHRYTVDSTWTVPHFEKMLYDNALLARIYLYSYQVTKDAGYSEVVEQTLNYLLREMRAGSGCFYSAEDADSEGVEGKYYVWTPKDLEESLDARQVSIAAMRYGVTASGNFDGATVLTRAASRQDIAGSLSASEEDVGLILDDIRDAMLTARSKRITPGKDTKILLSWNALAIRAFAEAGRILDRRDYLQAAEAAASFILSDMRVGDGFIRSFKDDASDIPAFLEDYAYLLEALVSLSETVPRTRYLATACEVADAMISRFWDENERAFYDAQQADDGLVVRPRSLFDNPIPSGNSSAVHALLRLAALTGEQAHSDIARSVIERTSTLLDRMPLGFSYMLCALEFSLASPVQVGVVTNDGADLEEFMRGLFEQYRPHLALSVGETGEAPLLEDRSTIEGHATAYVCEAFACRMPVSTAAEMCRELADAESRSRMSMHSI